MKGGFVLVIALSASVAEAQQSGSRGVINLQDAELIEEPPNKPRQLVSVLGLGRQSCGSFLESRAAGRSYHFMHYASGMITGYNAWGPQHGTGLNVMAGTDWEGAEQWLDVRCRAEPLLPFGIAILRLIDALEGRR